MRWAFPVGFCLGAIICTSMPEAPVVARALVLVACSVVGIIVALQAKA